MKSHKSLLAAALLLCAAAGVCQSTSRFDAAFQEQVRILNGLQQKETPGSHKVLRNCKLLKAKFRSKVRDVLWIACDLAGELRMPCCGEELNKVAANGQDSQMVRLEAITSLGLIAYEPAQGTLQSILEEPYSPLTGGSGLALTQISPARGAASIWRRLSVDNEAWGDDPVRARLKLFDLVRPRTNAQVQICKRTLSRMPPETDSDTANLSYLRTIVTAFAKLGRLPK
jgi:hypothetical protein